LRALPGDRAVATPYVRRSWLPLPSPIAADESAGEWVVGIAGAGIAAAGAALAVRSYRKHLRTSRMSRTTRRLVDTAGVTGGARWRRV
jgi:hypothetical protein